MKNKIHSIITIILAIYFIGVGTGKFFQKIKPLNENEQENIITQNYTKSKKGEAPAGYKVTMNTMKQSGFLKMIGVFEILAGILMIIPKLRIFGLFLLLPIIFNIFFMHIFFDNRIGENIQTGILLIVTSFLCYFYKERIRSLIFIKTKEK